MKSLLFILLPSALILSSCATQPRTYQPPDATKLKASTGKLSKEVEASHIAARKAQASVKEASEMAKHAKAEVAKIKNVPPTVTQEINDLNDRLIAAQQQQQELEQHLAEADKARAEVEKDKADYFVKAEKLAEDATRENGKAVKAEKSLSWYRWHWWGSWIVLGVGIIACIIFAVIKFAGKLPFP